jgi:hypothetical protein
MASVEKNSPMMGSRVGSPGVSGRKCQFTLFAFETA